VPPSEFRLNSFDIGAGTPRAHLRHDGRKGQIGPVSIAHEPVPDLRDGSPLSQIPLTLRRRHVARPQREIDLLHVLPTRQHNEAR